MASRRNAPRASISVTILRDPDVIMLRQSRLKGRAAWGDFVALIALAKDLGNGGKFEKPIEIVANLIHIRADSLRTSIDLITSTCRKCNSEPWVEWDENGYLVIRNYTKWNPLQENRGGARPGAGRPKKNQSVNQTDSKDIQSCAPPTRGIGIGDSSSSPEGEFGADLKILREIGPDDEVTAGDRYTAVTISSRAWSVVPAHARTAIGKFRDELILAIRRGEDPGRLIEQLRAYYASPQGQGQHFKLPATFLRDECYLDDPSAWESRDDRASTGGDGGTSDVERTQRRLAELRGETAPGGDTAP